MGKSIGVKPGNHEPGRMIRLPVWPRREEAEAAKETGEHILLGKLANCVVVDFDLKLRVLLDMCSVRIRGSWFRILRLTFQIEKKST